MAVHLPQQEHIVTGAIQEDNSGGGVMMTIDVPSRDEDVPIPPIVPQQTDGSDFIPEIKALRQEVKLLNAEILGYEKSKERVAELELELEITKIQLRRFQRNEILSLAVRREIALENLRRAYGGTEERLSQEEIEHNDYDTID